MCHIRVHVYVACLLVLCKGCISSEVNINVVKCSITCRVISGVLKVASAVKVLPIVDQIECRTLLPFT
jgi:hypothetical protein